MSQVYSNETTLQQRNCEVHTFRDEKVNDFSRPSFVKLYFKT